MYKIFLISALISSLSCKKQIEEYNSSVLIFDPKISNVIETKLIQDSILINSYSKDSILFLKYSNGDYKQSFYFKMNDVLFERRIKGNEIGEILETDSILSFSKRDTIFRYKSVRRFIITVLDYSYADCQYSIMKEGNNYKTIKQSLVDTTYKEIFFYDRDYTIYKYINTWKENKCVYIKRKN